MPRLLTLTGQPIRLTLLPGRNPFDTAFMPGRPLSERISAPGERSHGDRSRSLSPRRRVIEEEDASLKGIDRYIPGQNRRSRSPMPRRRNGGGGRRPGARREPGREQEGRREGRGNPRSKKTQEELDAEMEDYFGGGGTPAGGETSGSGAGAGAGAGAAAPQAAIDDMDMIE